MKTNGIGWVGVLVAGGLPLVACGEQRMRFSAHDGSFPTTTGTSHTGSTDGGAGASGSPGDTEPIVENARRLFAAYGSACVITDENEPVCFGLVTHAFDWPTPTTTGPVMEIVISPDGACALLEDGAVQCWGTDNFSATAPPSGSFTAIAENGFDVFCALDREHRTHCWGHPQYLTEPPAQKLFAIVGGEFGRFCGLTEAGDALCWGAPVFEIPTATTEGPFTELAPGNHVCGLGVDGGVRCWDAQPTSEKWGATEAPAGSFSSVVSRNVHSCALTKAGKAICWGRLHVEFESEVGDESPELLVAPDETFTSIVTGQAHMCGLTTSGEARCWGYGTSADDIYNEPNLGQASPPEGTFVELAAGDWHTCGLRDDGDVECWGMIAVPEP
ncbi:MAG TPA: RCC1 domain-containing protein [Polyangiaceae bacterium]|nr:RCC1 domain-containing protein [Polyangiaceae bacterium]